MEDLTKFLEKLATELGTTAEYLWTVLIKQSQVDAIVNFTFVGIMALIMIVGLVLIARIIKLDSDDGYDLSTRDVAWIFYGIVMAAAFITFVACLVPAIGQVANPEYWALEQVLGTVGTK